MYILQNLRERNCQLTEENTELQSLSVINRHSSGERVKHQLMCYRNLNIKMIFPKYNLYMIFTAFVIDNS